MRLTDARKVATAGVIVAAVLAASLVVPAFGQVLTLERTWLAGAILGLPVAAVLTATGYRHYGLGRAGLVAVVITVFTLVVTWLVAVFVVASALAGSATSIVMGVVLYGVPAVVVLILGLLALRLVPGRCAGRSFAHVDAG
ncbi:hypothetical protein H7J93_04155 [Mycobacterium barrassiae]|uniref:hypothetical protein n=1 Tax=Mycobacterium barrassiae TaxID=319709 RepID=UPI002265B982|nr:hypothetical protein [Mycobacterium barrassiae]MCV7298826.1 hypothetical protein [Mycobacterium barrassiae]